MRRTIDICTIIVLVVFLAGPAMLFCGEELLKVQLPSWFTSEDADLLSGHTENDDVSEHLSIDGLTSKELQNSIEHTLGNHIPGKAFAMLANSSLQRNAIVCANGLFGWDSYPSNYSSGYAIAPQLHLVVPISFKETQIDTTGFADLARVIRNVSCEYPETTFVYDFVFDVYSSPSNPTHDYVSGSVNEEETVSLLKEELGSQVSLLVESISNETELANEWNNTEHHWKLERALAAYNAIGNELDWEHVDYKDDLQVSDGWIGTSARAGLYLGIKDIWRDLPKDFSYLEIVNENGEKTVRGFRDKLLQGGEIDSRWLDNDFYWNYYGGCEREFIYRNPNSTNNRTCLFIGTSYSILLEPYIASNYGTTIVIYPFNSGTSSTIGDYIDKYGVDDVVVQTGYAATVCPSAWLE